VNSLDKITEDLAWLAEAKEEMKIVERRVKALQQKILEAAKELKMRGKVEFNYAGKYYEASLNIDRIRIKNPTIDDLKERIRKLLPEGEQTAENADKEWKSLCVEAPMNDSVTLKEVAGPIKEEEQKKLEA
jgi:outer membrane PBP1 activator LpoA protein